MNDILLGKTLYRNQDLILPDINEPNIIWMGVSNVVIEISLMHFGDFYE